MGQVLAILMHQRALFMKENEAPREADRIHRSIRSPASAPVQLFHRVRLGTVLQSAQMLEASGLLLEIFSVGLIVSCSALHARSTILCALRFSSFERC